MTGAGGFLGQPMVQRAKQLNHELYTLSSRPQTSHQDASVANSGSLWAFLDGNPSVVHAITRFSPDAVIHLGWGGLPDYGIENSLANFYTTIDFYRACRAMGISKFLISGSCWEYGALPGALTEDRRAAPESPFASAKQSLSELLMTDLFSHDVTIYWIRVFYAFGPHQRVTSLIPSAFARLAAGGEPEVKNPDRLVDLIHVDELADIFLELMTSPAASGVYNAGSGQPRLVGDVVDLLGQVWKNEVVEECPVVKDPTRGSWANMTKTNQVIAPRSSISLVDFFRVEATQMQRKLRLSRQ